MKERAFGGEFDGIGSWWAIEGRDVSKRFSSEEKQVLAIAMRDVWRNVGFDKDLAKLVDLRSGYGEEGCFEWGHYPDNEAYALVDENGGMRDGLMKGSDIYAMVNLEDDRDVVAMRAILDYMSVVRATVGTMYLPYARGDRPDKRDDGRRELLLLNTLIKDMSSAGVRKIVMVDGHSPALSWFLIKNGIAALDLTALPLLARESVNRGIIRNDLPTVVACGDDGAIEMGMMTSELLGARAMIIGDKQKFELIDDNTGHRRKKTIVNFSDEDLAKVEGAQVVIGEDIISSGGTLYANLGKLLHAGARQVVVLATYGIFAGEAIHRLAYNPLVKIVVTDGRKPQNNISEHENIIQIPAIHKMSEVLNMEKQGVDFWSNDGRERLMSLGFDLAPWQTHIT